MVVLNPKDIEYDKVFGVLYHKARVAQDLLEQDLKQVNAAHKVFQSKQACAQFAQEHNLHLKVYAEGNKGYYSVNYDGKILRPTEWVAQYRNILKYETTDQEGKKMVTVFEPDEFTSRNECRTLQEEPEGKNKPLYSRNYFLPFGVYDEETQTFNNVTCSDIFAEDVGADISWIYEYLKKISGECYPWLLAWLRAKLVYPTVKTQVVPVFTGAQGTGKSAFSDCLCSALFGGRNVVVSDKIDLSKNFNADHADKLIVSIEEKMEGDHRNTASTLKSSATTSQVRKEKKGYDAIWQSSHTDYVLTTNDPVPIKFDSPDDQRRFMVMETDPMFTKTSPITRDRELAKEIFTKLYGSSDGKVPALYNVQTRKVENVDAIKQLKYDLWSKKDMFVGGQEVTLRGEFPKTSAYKRCFSMPRTSEAVEIEEIVKAVAPFVWSALFWKQVMSTVEIPLDDGTTETLPLQDFLPLEAIFYTEENGKRQVFINKKSLFGQHDMRKDMSHATIDRVLYQLRPEFLVKYGIEIEPISASPSKGFRGLKGYSRFSTAVVFTAGSNFGKQNIVIESFEGATDGFVKAGTNDNLIESSVLAPTQVGTRTEGRPRYNKFFIPDENGELEPVNTMVGRERKAHFATSNNVFLLEADAAPTNLVTKELEFLLKSPKNKEVNALELYHDRLLQQELEGIRLFKEKKVCRLVYSGARSIHMLVQVQDSPNTVEERKWLFNYLCTTLSDKLNFDTQTGDVLRLTRAPIRKKRVSVYKIPEDIMFPPDSPDYQTLAQARTIAGEQQLIEEDWTNFYTEDWRSIYNRWCTIKENLAYEKVRGMPCKQIYKDASKAFLEGTFFTDEQWSGRRNELFFPMYRYLRLTGWSKDELWTELREQVQSYKQRDIIQYWISREQSNIIQQIEEDVSK